jgi:hypothetical protein
MAASGGPTASKQLGGVIAQKTVVASTGGLISHQPADLSQTCAGYSKSRSDMECLPPGIDALAAPERTPICEYSHFGSSVSYPAFLRFLHVPFSRLIDMIRHFVQSLTHICPVSLSCSLHPSQILFTTPVYHIMHIMSNNLSPSATGAQQGKTALAMTFQAFRTKLQLNWWRTVNKCQNVGYHTQQLNIHG